MHSRKAILLVVALVITAAVGFVVFRMVRQGNTTADTNPSESAERADVDTLTSELFQKAESSFQAETAIADEADADADIIAEGDADIQLFIDTSYAE